MYDIITIGSATVDILVDTKSKLFKKKINFGSKILIDNLRIYAGGSAINTSIAFAKFGLKTACITKIGRNGNKILDALNKENVDTQFVIQSNNDLTDHSIILDSTGKDRTILVYKNASKHLYINELNIKTLETKWFYFGTMVGESLNTLKKLARYASKNNIKIALNTSQYLAKQKPKELLNQSNILIVNKQEAKLLNINNSTLKSIYSKNPEIIVITNGDKQVVAYSKGKKYSITPHKNIKKLERTGAGDAFASGFVTGIIKKNNINFALQLGRANAESVIQYYGAQNKLLSKEGVNWN